MLLSAAFGAGNAEAQQTAVCSEAPEPGERIECTENDVSSNDIELTLKGVDIDTTEDKTHGVSGHHAGTGRIFLSFQTDFDDRGEPTIRNDIDTTGDRAHGLYGRHEGTGGIFLGGQNLHITTTGSVAHGVAGYLGYRPGDPDLPDLPPEAAGLIDIGVSDSIIEVTGSASHGIAADNDGGEGQLRIDVRNSTITSLSEGFGGRGIYGLRWGTTTGDASATVSNTTITTKSRSGRGIDLDHAGEDTANLTIEVTRGSITTFGYNGYAVRGQRRAPGDHLGTGNIDIDVVGTVINTSGPHGRGIDAYMYSNNGDIDVFAENIDFTSTGEQGHGIRTRLQTLAGGETGDILVDVRGGSITTRGAFAYGLYNRHEGTGIVDIDIRNLDSQHRKHGDLSRYRHLVRRHLWPACRRGRHPHRRPGRVRHDGGEFFLRYLRYS